MRTKNPAEEFLLLEYSESRTAAERWLRAAVAGWAGGGGACSGRPGPREELEELGLGLRLRLS